MVTRCENGHWYDEAVHRVCPHCKRNSEKLNMRIEDDVVEDDKTIAFAQADLSLGEELGAIIGNSAGNSGVLNDDVFGGNSFEFGGDGDDKTISFGFFGVVDVRPVTGWLVVMNGSEKGKDYRLIAGKNFIGRGTSMDIVLADDKKISRDKHCNVLYDHKSNMFYVAPEGGNMSYLNGQLIIKPSELKEGDVIKIGDTELLFVPFCKGERLWKEE